MPPVLPPVQSVVQVGVDYTHVQIACQGCRQDGRGHDGAMERACVGNAYRRGG